MTQDKRAEDAPRPNLRKGQGQVAQEIAAAIANLRRVAEAAARRAEIERRRKDDKTGPGAA